LALGTGLLLGLLGEGLLFAWSQCRRVEEVLFQDFKALALVAQGVGEDRLKLAQERLLFQPEVVSVEFISRQQALEALSKRDPELAKSVTLLGDNPLPAGFEVRFSPQGLEHLSEWVRVAGSVPEISRVEYKQAQLQALLQARADARYLASILALGLWMLAAISFSLFVAGLGDLDRATHWLGDSMPGIGCGALGGALGAALALLAALPLLSSSPFWSWPPGWGVPLVSFAGAMSGWIVSRLVP